MKTITLICAQCMRVEAIERTDQDPAAAVSVVTICPSCDNGEPDVPVYFDKHDEVLDTETSST